MFAPEGISWTTLDRSDLRGVAPHGTNLTTVSHLSESLIAGIPCVLCKYDDTLCSRLEFSASSPAVFNDNATYERALSLSLSVSLLTHGAFFSFFPHTRTFAYLVHREETRTIHVPLFCVPPAAFPFFSFGLPRGPFRVEKGFGKEAKGRREKDGNAKRGGPGAAGPRWRRAKREAKRRSMRRVEGKREGTSQALV